MGDDLREAVFNRAPLTVSTLPFILRENVFSVRRETYWGKYSLLNDILRWRSCSGVPHGGVYRIYLWPFRRDHHSNSDWPVRVLVIDVSTRIGR